MFEEIGDYAHSVVPLISTMREIFAYSARSVNDVGVNDVGVNDVGGLYFPSNLINFAIE
ncbi:MAG: hypothetical protein ACI8W1_000671 [Candidatus Azotimanducaceae bacterium]|jgi:hypothetical protein